MKNLYFFALFILLIGEVNVSGQQTEQGIEFFNKGNYQEAINLLKKSDDKDIIAQYHYGLSLENSSQTKEALKIYEKAVNKTIVLIENQLRNIYSNTRNDKMNNQEIIQSRIGNELEAAIKSLKRLQELNPKKTSSIEWQTKAILLEMYEKKSEEKHQDESSVGIDKPLKITRKTFPRMSETARQNRTNGSIRLLVAFLKNGEIGFIIPMNRLPDGLTETAINAAKEIKFEPATKNGKPITVFKSIEYSFMVF